MNKKLEWVTEVPGEASSSTPPSLFPPDSSLLPHLNLHRWYAMNWTLCTNELCTLCFHDMCHCVTFTFNIQAWLFAAKGVVVNHVGHCLPCILIPTPTFPLQSACITSSSGHWRFLHCRPSQVRLATLAAQATASQ